MSRSRKHTPVTGTYAASSEKWWKSKAHRAFRARVRSAIKRGLEAIPQKLREVRDIYSGPKDGKQRFNPRVSPTLMRK